MAALHPTASTAEQGGVVYLGVRSCRPHGTSSYESEPRLRARPLWRRRALPAPGTGVEPVHRAYGRAKTLIALPDIRVFFYHLLKKTWQSHSLSSCTSKIQVWASDAVVPGDGKKALIISTIPPFVPVSSRSGPGGVKKAMPGRFQAVFSALSMVYYLVERRAGDRSRPALSCPLPRHPFRRSPAAPAARRFRHSFTHRIHDNPCHSHRHIPVARQEKIEKIEEKIDKAKEWGLHEPVSIHPKIDIAKCIGSGACVKACPEKDILGLAGGKGQLINASQCIGHGACAIACPMEAITLVFGTETRGVDIPWVSPEFETNVPGVFIVGELGGMGLIKNSVTQGREAMEHIAAMLKQRKAMDNIYDVVIVGAGPGRHRRLARRGQAQAKGVTIDQNDLGGTVLQYPRHKIVMTSPVELPMYGKVRMRETTKEALLELWEKVFDKTGLKINSGEKMTGLVKDGCNRFVVNTVKDDYATRFVVLAIGRRGTPRKLGVPGEEKGKVTYSLKDPEQYRDKHILVVGGGDSAVEAAMALCAQPGNTVTLSYRNDKFSRIKPGNRTRLEEAVAGKKLKIAFKSNVVEIKDKEVVLDTDGKKAAIANDYVYIFAGGELPNEFLKSIGIRIEKKFGTAMNETG